MAQSVLKFDPGGRQEALGEQRPDGENGGCIRLAIYSAFPSEPAFRSRSRFYYYFIIIIIIIPPPRAFQRALLAGRPDFFGAGGCLSTWHGVGGFTTNSPSSPQVIFLLWHKSILKIALARLRPTQGKGVRGDAQPPSGVSRPQNVAFRLRLNHGLCEKGGWVSKMRI